VNLYLETMTYRLAVRIGLGWLALSALQLGVWALLAPQSFYDGFPGFGRSWVAADGPFNEHLVRDFGALNLAIGALLIYAAVKVTRELVTISAIASLVWGVPHLLYHLFNTEPLSAADNVFSIGGLAVAVIFAALLWWAGGRLEAPQEVNHGTS